MHYINKRLTALLFALLMLLSALTASAEQALVLRDAPVYNTEGTVVGTLPVGTITEIVAEQSSWTMVRAGTYAGLVKAEDVGKITLLNGAAAYAAHDAALYESFSKDARKLCTVPSGSAVSVGAVAGEWALVRFGDWMGFMTIAALTPNAPAQPKPNTAALSVPAYAKVDGAKLYDASGKVIGSVAVNTAVTIQAVRSGVCLVKHNSKTACMLLSELSPTKVTVQKPASENITIVSPTTFYVKNNGAKVYSSSGKSVGTLGLNTAVTVTAYNDTLAMISGSGYQGLMYRSDLSASKIPVSNPTKQPEPTKKPEIAVTEINPTTFYVKNDGAKVLNASGDCIATLSLNASVVVNAYTGDLARVVNGSTVGFMRKSDLSSGKTQSQSTLALRYGDSGEAVKSLQARLKELGYFTGTVGGNYLDLTRVAVTAFQTVAKLEANGVADQATLAAIFADNAPKAPEPEVSTDGMSTVKAATGTAVEMDWWTSDIRSIFSVGTIATVTDVSTGIAWLEKRTGGTNHADVQPATAADTAAMKKAVGSWTWNRRPIFVTINGVNYAASMNAMPHGSDSIASNNFDGHHCIHFTNSRTHGSNKVCSLHQAAIKKAAAATL